ncbi:MAG: elongation factor G [Lentimicrobiaceae bacterium]|jgi:elongation factor G|nr:elongation factor G [Lentimicrobiaceae bacterium]MCP4910764.1 elongation factor G [Bacteroidota bacterium]MBT3455411.1 elongation factor G [Lentimicrobiaceae bacterium]MBT3818749.1 elongation factor G [Lentimicrobiaceae bacterium]MBT4062016.1 elongation factor G [Lentimicrobiaceae bacterium]
MKIYQTEEIRNIALIGGAKSGKTTMAEAMVFEGKVISRRGNVDDKNTVSDYRPIELDRQHSVHSTLMYSVYNEKKINIIDVPGFSDFVGDTAAALNVCDTALFMVNGQSGVEATSEIAWGQTEISSCPTVFAVNQLDHQGANFNDSVNSLKEYFGDKVTVIQYPVSIGEGFNTIIDLMLMKQLKFNNNGGEPEISDIPDSEKDKADDLHLTLVENAAEGDEKLMEKYFENDTLTLEEMREGVRLGMISRSIFPVMCTSAKSGIGATRVMDFITNSCPAPNEMPERETTNGKAFKTSTSDPTALFVFKTSIEQHLGEVSCFKLYGGTLTEGMDLINPRTGNKERLSQFFVLNGKNREKIEKVVAGDIAITIKLKDVRTGDSLMDSKVADAGFEGLTLPVPIYTVAMSAVDSGDDEKLGTILNEMHRTDPTIEIEYSRELKQLLVKTQGEFHLNTIKWYMQNAHKIKVETDSPKIPYRETITKTANADYRHKKQSGGSGQFGEVHLRIMPYFDGYKDPTDIPVRGTDVHDMPWGGKLIVNNCIVGGAIDARFLPAILKGVMERMTEGPLTGSYARDIVVYIYDGKMHPVDSNEISFKLAGRNAFSTAFKNAGPKIMEPVNDVEITVPEDMMGAVMTDLQGRRGIIMGMGAKGRNQVIKAKIPAAEMTRYATSLSAITSGRGVFSSEFDQYQQVPSDVQNQLLKAYEASQEDED